MRYAAYAKRKWVTAGKVDRFSLKNQDKYILYAHGLFEYILDTAPLDVRMRNPFDRLLHGEETIKQRRGEVRAAWTTDEIKKLLTSPVWAGCRSEWYRTEPGDLILKDHRYWIPLICLFAGLRLAEACQLKARDFEIINDNAVPFRSARSRPEDQERFQPASCASSPTPCRRRPARLRQVSRRGRRRLAIPGRASDQASEKIGRTHSGG
jgi:integrase